MILTNAIPRLEEAIEDSNLHNSEREVKFIYNEMLTHDTIMSVFEWLFRKSIDFRTKHDEYRFVVIIYPKK